MVSGTDRDSRTLYEWQLVEQEGAPTSPCDERRGDVEPESRAVMHWVPYNDGDDDDRGEAPE